MWSQFAANFSSVRIVRLAPLNNSLLEYYVKDISILRGFLFFGFRDVITKGAATGCSAGLGLAPTDRHPLLRQTPFRRHSIP